MDEQIRRNIIMLSRDLREVESHIEQACLPVARCACPIGPTPGKRATVYQQLKHTHLHLRTAQTKLREIRAGFLGEPLVPIQE